MTAIHPTGHPTVPHGPGLAASSLALGVVALVLSFIPLVNVATFPLALVALPLGGIATTDGYRGRGMAIAGVVTAGLSLVVVLAMIASFSSFS